MIPETYPRWPEAMDLAAHVRPVSEGIVFAYSHYPSISRTINIFDVKPLIISRPISHALRLTNRERVFKRLLLKAKEIASNAIWSRACVIERLSTTHPITSKSFFLKMQRTHQLQIKFFSIPGPTSIVCSFLTNCDLARFRRTSQTLEKVAAQTLSHRYRIPNPSKSRPSGCYGENNGPQGWGSRILNAIYLVGIFKVFPRQQVWYQKNREKPRKERKYMR